MPWPDHLKWWEQLFLAAALVAAVFIVLWILSCLVGSGMTLLSGTAARRPITPRRTASVVRGQAPSSVNDSARGMMAAVAVARRHQWHAYYGRHVNSLHPDIATLRHRLMDGATIAFIPNVTSGATVTLNVDGLGAKPLRLAPPSACHWQSGRWDGLSRHTSTVARSGISTTSTALRRQ
jgi:hypothetical protein